MQRSLAISCMLLVAAGVAGMAGYAEAEAGVSLDSVTFIKYPDGVPALEAVSNGTLDMHTFQIPADMVKNAMGDRNLQVFRTSGAVVYTVTANPADADGQPFNPFSIREVRYALNHLVDRDRIVREVLGGSGTPLLSGIYPLHPDYPLVHRQLDELDISYDPILADRMISAALESSGATKVAGKWSYGGSPIQITVSASDGPVLAAIAGLLIEELEDMGFVVERRDLDLAGAFAVVYGSDPADFEWHLHVESYGGFTVQKESRGTLSFFYGPWAGHVPGWTNPDYWGYENRLLDDLTYAIFAEDFDSAGERARLIRDVVEEGVNEAVRSFIAVEHINFAVNENVSGVVNAPGTGIASRYTPINAQTPSGNLNVGAQHITQSAWNPVGGFRDTDAYAIWNILRDPAHSSNPFTGDLMPVRASWEVETEPGGGLDIPDDAILWNPFTHVWEGVPPGSQSTSRVTFDLLMGNWHSGPAMDINDILYPLYFHLEHNSQHEGHDHPSAGRPQPSILTDALRAVRVVDNDTIEVYLNYTGNEDETVRLASLWGSIPWELFAAMEAAVLDGRTAFYTDEAHGTSWLSMLDRADSELLREYLERFISEEYVPPQLLNSGPDYAISRYASTISWIEQRGHSVISNGPFYLDTYWPENGTLRAAAYADGSYPFGPDHWRWLAGEGSLEGEILVGSLAPRTGGAHRYGADIHEASRLAVADFNNYLEKRGEPWRLEPVRFDTMTDPQVALQRLAMLHDMGIRIVDGPAIDYGAGVLDFANDNDMVLLSCCSSTPSLSIMDDALFRLLPDQTRHGAAIAALMYGEGIRAIAPVGIDSPWATELLSATTAEFERLGGTAAATTTFASEDYSGATAALDDMVNGQIDDNRIDRVAVLYVGFGEAPDLLNAASLHKILGDVRWFGADQNTASPNVLDDTTATRFAEKVEFTVVQPAVQDNPTSERVSSIVGGYLGREPSPYAGIEYDTVWLLGLSILYAGSADGAAVAEVLPEVASKYVGALGSTTMTPAGYLSDIDYMAWIIEGDRWIQAAD